MSSSVIGFENPLGCVGVSSLVQPSCSWHGFQRKKQRMLKEDYIGDQLFWLYEQFCEKKLSSMIPAPRLKEVAHAGKKILEDSSYWSSWALCGAVATGAYLVASAACPLLAPAVLVAGPVGAAYGVSADVDKYHEGLDSDEEELKNVACRSLKNLGEEGMKVSFSAQPSLEAARICSLFLDLKGRKITQRWSSEKETPLLLELQVLLKKISEVGKEGKRPFPFNLSFAKESPIQPRHMEQIQEPVNVARWDQELRWLYENYLDFAEKKLAHHSLPSGHLFEELEGKSVLLYGESEEFVPLAFPSSLIETLQKELQEEVEAGEWVGSGYRFHASSYTLEVGFKKGETHLFKKVASFDESTVRSFFRDVVAEHEEEQLSAFLILALYASYGGESLGLPGDQTKEFGKLIAPVIRPFPGLYQLWTHHPQLRLEYRKERYSALIQEIFFRAVQDQEKQGQKLNIFAALGLNL